MHSLFRYFKAICTCADSLFGIIARDASKTPESPATDSLLTAADTERVFDVDDVRLKRAEIIVTISILINIQANM